MALISTFIYVHLMVTGALNARINPYDTGGDEKSAVLLSKIKYVLLVIMALSWGAVIRFW